jgi:circadian clock protein KaiC
MERRRAAVQRQIAELQASLESEEDEVSEWLEQDDARERSYVVERDVMATRRGAAE